MATPSKPKAEVVDPAASPGTDLVPASDSEFAVIRYSASGENELAKVITENTGAGGVRDTDLDRVVMPSGGVTTWMVPGLSGDEPVQTIEGVIVEWSEPRGFWAESLDVTGGGTPPDCSSRDSIVGHPTDEARAAFGITGDCRTCPMAEWGSAGQLPGAKGDTNAQACKQRRHLFVVRPDDLLPLVVSLSPGSLQAISKYFLRLSSRGKAYYSVVTKLGLVQAKSGGGITYAQVDPTFVRELSPGEVGAVREYAAGLRGAFNAITITQEEAQAQ